MKKEKENKKDNRQLKLLIITSICAIALMLVGLIGNIAYKGTYSISTTRCSCASYGSDWILSADHKCIKQTTDTITCRQGIVNGQAVDECAGYDNCVLINGNAQGGSFRCSKNAQEVKEAECTTSWTPSCYVSNGKYIWATTQSQATGNSVGLSQSDCTGCASGYYQSGSTCTKISTCTDSNSKFNTSTGKCECVSGYKLDSLSGLCVKDNSANDTCFGAPAYPGTAYFNCACDCSAAGAGGACGWDCSCKYRDSETCQSETGQYCDEEQHTYALTKYKCYRPNGSSIISDRDPVTGKQRGNCTAGQYYAGNGTSCVTCERGSYCPGESFIVDVGHTMGIHPCPSGYTTVSTGAASISACTVKNSDAEATRCIVGEPYRSGATGFYANVSFTGMTINQCCASKGWGVSGTKCYTDGGITAVDGTEYVYHDPVDGECAEGYKKISVAVGTGRKTVCVEERCNCDGDGCGNTSIKTPPSNQTPSDPTPSNPTPSDPTPSDSPTVKESCYGCDVDGSKMYVYATSEGNAANNTGGKNCAAVADRYCNVPVNPKTGTIAIIIAWVVGVIAIGYSFWYFMKMNSFKTK